MSLPQISKISQSSRGTAKCKFDLYCDFDVQSFIVIINSKHCSSLLLKMALQWGKIDGENVFSGNLKLVASIIEQTKAHHRSIHKASLLSLTWQCILKRAKIYGIVDTLSLSMLRDLLEHCVSCSRWVLELHKEEDANIIQYLYTMQSNAYAKGCGKVCFIFVIARKKRNCASINEAVE